MSDPLNVFSPEGQFEIAGAGTGPLAGLRFLAKDLYDVAGHKTGAGNPVWRETHEPATVHAAAVRQLLDAGARLVGKTITDEMAYSLNGRNIHYGTPTNSAAPDRLPGGSSSGSAAAIAGNLADFALGTDTGGSVRVPASYCGIYGFRPTHGRVSLEGVHKLSASFDTVGWFARDPELLERVARVLFGKSPAPLKAKRLLRVDDAFATADPEVATALKPLVDRATTAVGRVEGVKACPSALTDWLQIFRVLQGREAWLAHGSWIQRNTPGFAPDIVRNFDFASKVKVAEVEEARQGRLAIAKRLAMLLENGAVMCLPAAPAPPPLRETPDDELNGLRMRIISLTCIAGLAGLPQITIPAGTAGGGPIGFSLIGPRDSDLMVIRLAAEIARLA